MGDCVEEEENNFFFFFFSTKTLQKILKDKEGGVYTFIC